MSTVAETRAKRLARVGAEREWGLEDIVTLVAYVILTVWAILALFPIYWMIKNSFEPMQMLVIWPPRILPWWEELTLDNYAKLAHRAPMARWFLNSLVITAARTAGTLIFGAMAGYSFAKLRFWGREVLFWSLMSVIMIPAFITIIPTYQVIVWLHWDNTFLALIVPGITGGIGAMFLIRQFLRTLPTEIMESARMDGASEPAIFWKLVMPLAKPSLAVLGIYTFVGNWNSFLWPLIVTRSKEMRTLPVGLSLIKEFISSQSQSVGSPQYMAGATVASVPTILAFLLFQRYFLKGITIGAIKG
ncbi:MAG: carbohydrate ABC transporter permease [Anaerolineae bacterium]|nr:carbohydrate ABC transporter permease [Anaerolineae bacterium]